MRWLALILGLAAAGAADAESAFGCRGLDVYRPLPAIEGRAGTFFRIDPDLRTFHPFSREVADQVAALSAALEARGTTLIYVPTPTRGLAMAQHLTSEALDHGFEETLAITLYDETLERLRSRGVRAVDARAALRAAPLAEPPFFGTDDRLTPGGARRLALAVAETLANDPVMTALPRGVFTTEPGAEVVLPSVMREQLQQSCSVALPAPVGRIHRTSGEALGAPGAGPAPRIVVVGTHLALEPASNVAGFLSAALGVEVEQRALPTGDAFASIAAYLTSQAFRDAPPPVLVWESPIHNNLARFGPQAMAELIAAARTDCRVPLALDPGDAPERRVADLGRLDPAVGHALALDTGGAPARMARFRFRLMDGRTVTESIWRPEAAPATGRFFLSLDGIWGAEVLGVEVELDVPYGALPRLAACPDRGGAL